MVRERSVTPLIIFCGSTASGKSSAAVRCAHALGGEVLNVDSVQCYRGFDIGTAKISVEDQEGIPHHGIDIYEPNEKADAATFADFARNQIAEIQAQEKPVICVAGTSLYMKAILYGMADLPQGDLIIRKEMETVSSEDLHSELVRVDKKTADRIHPNDRRRVTRALETFKTTNIPPSELKETHGFKDILFPSLFIHLTWDRLTLHDRIKHRTDLMLKQGIVNEVRGLRSKWGNLIKPFESIGYVESLAHLDGRLPAEELSEAIASKTRKLAKQQTTFWRNEPGKRQWDAFPKAGERALLIDGEAGGLGTTTATAVYDIPFEELLQRIKAFQSRTEPSTEIWYVRAQSVTS